MTNGSAAFDGVQLPVPTKLPLIRPVVATASRPADDPHGVEVFVLSLSQEFETKLLGLLGPDYGAAGVAPDSFEVVVKSDRGPFSSSQTFVRQTSRVALGPWNSSLTDLGLDDGLHRLEIRDHDLQQQVDRVLHDATLEVQLQIDRFRVDLGKRVPTSLNVTIYAMKDSMRGPINTTFTIPRLVR